MGKQPEPGIWPWLCFKIRLLTLDDFLKYRLDYVMVNDISTLLLTAQSLSNTVKGAVSAQEVMQRVALE